MTALGAVFSLAGHFGDMKALFTLGNLALAFGLFGYLNHYVLYPASVRFQERTMPRLEERYRVFLQWVLAGGRPKWMFLGTIGLLFLSSSSPACSRRTRCSSR